MQREREGCDTAKDSFAHSDVVINSVISNYVIGQGDKLLSLGEIFKYEQQEHSEATVSNLCTPSSG